MDDGGRGEDPRVGMPVGMPAGTEVGGYRLLAPLGSGGMGTVYRAVDGGGAVVALKLLHPHVGADPAARARLRREVAALQRLRHPGVAAVLDAEVDSSEAFVVTELVDGLTLEEHVRRGGPLPPVELAELADGLRDALEAVHGGGVVHRDLKPSNVMLTAEGPVLIDFGIAQDAEDVRVTSAGFVVGTPGYLAPELLADGDPSAATDWWGWAAVLAFAATGRPPFGTRPLDAVLARTRAGDVDLAGLDPAVAAPVRAALHPEPGRRAAPDDVVADLDAAAAQVPDAPPTQAVTRATAALSGLAGPVGAWVDPRPATVAMDRAAAPPAPAGWDGPMDDDTRTRMLAQDGRTRAVPVATAPPDVPGDRDGREYREPSGPGGGSRDDDPWDDRAYPGSATVAGPDDDAGDDAGDDSGGWDGGAAGDARWDATGDMGWDGGAAGPPAYAATRPRRRTGSVLALGVLAVAGAMLYPVLTGLVLLVVLVLVRTVGADVEAVEARRERRGGPARGDAARGLASSPWHLLRAIVGLLPSVLVAASVVAVVGGVLWWLLETGRLVVSAAGPTPDGGNGPLAFCGALGVTAVLAVAVAWFGPLSRLTRTGARHTLRGVAPGWSGATVLVTLALAATGVLLVLLVTGQPISWWPLGDAPVLSRTP